MDRHRGRRGDFVDCRAGWLASEELRSPELIPRMYPDGPVRQIGLSCRPTRLWIDSCAPLLFRLWVPSNVYKEGLSLYVQYAINCVSQSFAQFQAKEKWHGFRHANLYAYTKEAGRKSNSLVGRHQGRLASKKVWALMHACDKGRQAGKALGLEADIEEGIKTVHLYCTGRQSCYPLGYVYCILISY